MAVNSNAGRQGTGKINGAGTGSAGKAGNTGRTGKKGHGRLKRSVCRTLGALFLASALVVAAIPVDGLRASEPLTGHTGTSVKVNVFENGLPQVDSSATIYSYYMEGTSVIFRFAFVDSSGHEAGDTRYAVILGYEQVGNLDGGVLKIPESMEAYRKYSVESTITGSAAVNLDNQFLYYMRKEIVKDTNGNPVPEYEDGIPKKDGAGNPIYVTESVYYPCLYSSRSTWINDKQFYVRDGAGDDGKPLYKENTVQRIANATVSYIGNQYIKQNTDVATKDDKEFIIAGVVSEAKYGVFHGQTNITTLVLPNSISGIGDYAFANCGFASVEFGNGLRCLGKYAFSGCGSMTRIKIDPTCPLSKLGEYCFENCGMLPSIDLPGYVQEIGDYAFRGCAELKSINMIYPDAKNEEGESAPLVGALNKLGQSVFLDCSKLEQLVFPNSYTEKVDVSEFKGCTSLEYIRSGYKDDEADGNMTFVLKDGDLSGFGWKEFLAQCPKVAESTESRFYLWGRRDSALHKIATEKKIAFKFYDNDMKMNVYEKVVPEIGDDGEETGETATYWVNDSNELVSCKITDGLNNLALPETIGPKNINSIGSSTFQNKCNLYVVTIPASVGSIADEAFRGCHNLRTVIFTNAKRVNSIGKNAFDTQDFRGTHADACPTNEKKPVKYLNFVGTISPESVPFQYAMSDRDAVGLGSVNKTYLTYLSGFPTHLVVRRNEATKLNELIDYPTYNDLLSGRYTKDNGFDYMSKVFEDEIEAIQKANGNIASLTPYQREIVDSVLNLKLPDGIEAIATVEVASAPAARSVAAAGAKLVDSAPKGQEVASDQTVGLGEFDSTRIGLFRYKEDSTGTTLLQSRGMDESYTPGTLTDNDRAGTGLRKTLVAENIRSVTPGAFRDCDAFRSVSLKGELEAVGNYAFADCDNLTEVSISESVSALGRAPFIGCGKDLSKVDFNGSDNFVCDNSIIYQLDGSGEKAKLVEYLFGRMSPMVGADELSSVSEIAPEAFRKTEVVSVDLRESTIKRVPEDAFRDTPQLVEVSLPTTCTSIGDNAFTDSNIMQLRAPASVAVINPTAFDGTTKTAGKLIFKTPEGSIAYTFATENGFKKEAAEDPKYCTVTFMSGYDFTTLDTKTVLKGESVKAPPVPDVAGMRFVGWSRSLENIIEDTIISAKYEEIKANTYTVRFYDKGSDTPMKTSTVAEGEDATGVAPTNLSRDGYRFTGWDRPLSNVTSDIDTWAEYEKIDSSEYKSYTVVFTDWDGRIISTQTVQEGKDAVIPQSPVRSGYTFTGWVPVPTRVTKDMTPVAQYIHNSLVTPGPGSTPTPPPGSTQTPGPGNSGGNSGSNDDDGDDDDNGGGWGDSELFTLTVRNGSGSGSYVANSMPVIIADQASSTQEFDHWTIQPEQALIASTTQAATVVTMPHCDVIVTAHYRTRTGDPGGNPPVATNPPANTPRPSGGNTNHTGGGTTVVIDKNGLSNTGVVSVVINGSSDNFVMKVAENSSATEAVLRALIAEYGSIENIKYFPMDITLYDSTGSRRITDTTGLKIDITLPLPDSLKIYAGNNKVAGVVNDKLDKLSPKFTTINGVPCVTFSAEHFSPYVIYVDTSRLGQGTGADDTPKTGDPIHPKWFLSIGLACLSLCMFMQKDTKKKKKVAVRAK